MEGSQGRGDLWSALPAQGDGGLVGLSRRTCPRELDPCFLFPCSGPGSVSTFARCVQWAHSGCGGASTCSEAGRRGFQSTLCHSSPG